LPARCRAQPVVRQPPLERETGLGRQPLAAVPPALWVSGARRQEARPRAPVPLALVAQVGRALAWQAPLARPGRALAQRAQLAQRALPVALAELQAGQGKEAPRARAAVPRAGSDTLVLPAAAFRAPARVASLRGSVAGAAAIPGRARVARLPVKPLLA
jgi:hypothetical protein